MRRGRVGGGTGRILCFVDQGADMKAVAKALAEQAAEIGALKSENAAQALAIQAFRRENAAILARRGLGVEMRVRRDNENSSCG